MSITSRISRIGRGIFPRRPPKRTDAENDPIKGMNIDHEYNLIVRLESTLPEEVKRRVIQKYNEIHNIE